MTAAMRIQRTIELRSMSSLARARPGVFLALQREHLAHVPQRAAPSGSPERPFATSTRRPGPVDRTARLRLRRSVVETRAARLRLRRSVVETRAARLRLRRSVVESEGRG